MSQFTDGFLTILGALPFVLGAVAALLAVVLVLAFLVGVGRGIKDLWDRRQARKRQAEWVAQGGLGGAMIRAAESIQTFVAEAFPTLCGDVAPWDSNQVCTSAKGHPGPHDHHRLIRDH